MEGESSKVADDAATELSIWEKMVLEERKLEAEKRGIRLCDLEEETSLFRALEESVPEKQNATDGKSSSTSSASSSSSNRPMSTMPSSIVRESKRMTTASQIAATVSDEDEEYHNNDDEENSDDEKQRAQLLPALPGPYAANVRTISSSMAVSDIPVTEVLQELCIWQLFLPQDLTNRILMFLGDVDMCGYLHQIARTNCFKPNESVYKTLCESVYLTQSKKKKLVVENWKSWRNMLGKPTQIRIGLAAICLICY